MAGTKRGGFRGGGGGAYKKGNFKKRAASDDEDSAPRASKKAKDEEEDEDPTPFVPEIKTNKDGDKFVGVSIRLFVCFIQLPDNHEVERQRQATAYSARIQEEYSHRHTRVLGR
jgi:hypothetical protein